MVNTTSITASWSMPYGIVDYYEVSCSNGVASTDKVYASEYLIASCTGLNPGGNYTISVTSVSSDIRSETDTIKITSYPNSAVLRSSEITTRQITVQWDDPEGEEDYFIVDCGADWSTEFILNHDHGTDNTFEATCNVSMAGAPYDITVTSVSGDKESSVTQTFTAATPDVVTFEDSSSNTTSVTVTWNVLTGADWFRVECSDGYPFPDYYLPGSATAVTCNWVTSGGNHSISVITRENNGESPAIVVYIVAVPAAVTLYEEIYIVNTTSITASWTMPNDIVDYYEVSCSNGVASTDKVYASEYLIASCTGLNPGGNYTISVTSVSSDIRSETDTITITTYPKSAVLRSSEITTRQITVQWDDPEGEEDYFIVDCGADWSTEFILNHDQGTDNTFEATCNVSMAGAPYDITVTSVSGDKESPVTGTFTAATPDVVTFEDSSSNTTSVTVTWNVLTGADGFRVDCSEGVPSPDYYLPGSATEGTCIWVTPGRNHSISVVTLENNGESTAMVVYIVAVPAAVTLYEEIYMVNTTSITASWTMPNGIVDYYEVSCSNGVASTDKVYASEYLIASCTGLNPGGNYTISVTSVSSDIRSETDTITITTYPKSAVLRSSEITTRQITVQWDDPEGEEDYFIVDCGADWSTEFILNHDQGTDNTFEATCNVSMAGAPYDITVTSVSGDKESPVTGTFTAATPDVVTFEDSSSNTTSVTVTWNVLTGADGFRVDCSEGVPSPDYYLPGSATEGTCIWVTPGRNHSISVVTLENNGESPAMVVYIVAVPAAVTLNEEIYMVNTTTITASWSMPYSIVDYYEVSCSNGVASTDKVYASEYLIASCTGLNPGGNYTISVTSVSSDISSETDTITITTYPNSAVLRSSEITTRQITVQWDDPEGEEDYFIVDCGAHWSTEFILNHDHGTDNTFEATCNVSIAGAFYDITVTSVSGDKESPVTQTFTAATPDVVTFEDSSSNTTSVTVTWNVLTGADWFRVDCSEGYPSPDYYLPGSATEVTCIWVTPGRNHSISVVTLENNGESPAMVVYIVAVPEAVTLNEEIYMVNTTTITASWTMPYGIVDYYEVSCSNGVASTDKVYASEYLIAYCTGLTPGGNYTISVTSVSSDERSETDTITITALPEAVELSEGESNITAISATWTVPDSVVDTFKITCSDGTASPASIPVHSSHCGQQLTAYCVGLTKPREQYDLSVVAISNNKPSAVSTITVFALPLGVDLEEGPSTLTSVNASWMRQNDTVERYRIACSRGDAFPSTIEDTDQELFSAACVNLPGPGETYGMTVYSEVGTGSSSYSTRASSLIYLVAVPESVENISVSQYTTTTVDVQWHLKQWSGCVFDYFLLTFEPDSQEPIRVDYMTGVNEYSSQMSNLTEGRHYNFTVVSVSGVGVEDATPKTSEGKSVDQRTVPATPSELSIVPGQRELNLVWAYAGDADDFTITVTPDHGIAVFNGDFTDPAAEVTDLIPGTTYDIAIITVSGDERSEPITQTARTRPYSEFKHSLLLVLLSSTPF
ncbi:fibronectin-like isoform X2 [Strongylocentrotus purpuratus]|uniref:Fibronectin type-III domain-containing protein n=1 Tax=Strongylocentrotus purpuratus TaxID=7668 RepID=A0A7M7NZH9_STRPU|nr:fibronectin-like isoform X2 [Strongylocentrotus purpuratus]